jgi:hypothetical protein
MLESELIIKEILKLGAWTPFIYVCFMKKTPPAIGGKTRQILDFINEASQSGFKGSRLPSR